MWTVCRLNNHVISTKKSPKMFKTMFEQIRNFFKQMKSLYWRFPFQTKIDVTIEDVTLLKKCLKSPRNLRLKSVQNTCALRDLRWKGFYLVKPLFWVIRGWSSNLVISDTITRTISKLCFIISLALNNLSALKVLQKDQKEKSKTIFNFYDRTFFTKDSDFRENEKRFYRLKRV